MLVDYDTLGKIYTVKSLVQSPPKRQQFCKIHEGIGQGVQILVTFFTKNK